MRRPTLIILVALAIVIGVAALVQLSQEAPTTPFEGPSVPGGLPSGVASIGGE